MSITQETVVHVARLARLALTPEEISRYTQDLGNILTLVEQLNEADLSSIEVAPDMSQPTCLRPDKPLREFPREVLMQNAPQEEEGFFRVPKILGDDA